MPVRHVGGGCYQWGHHGKVYCGHGAKEKAERQGRAAYSHGYQGTREAPQRLTPTRATHDALILLPLRIREWATADPRVLRTFNAMARSLRRNSRQPFSEQAEYLATEIFNAYTRRR